MIGANYDDTLSAPSVTLDATERFKWSQAKMYASINGGGEAEVKINAFDWTYNTNLEDDHFVMGATHVAALPVGDQSSALKLTVTEESASTLLSWYRMALKTSGRDSVVFRLAVQGSLIGATTQTAGFEIKGYFGEIIDAPAQIDAKNRLRQVDLGVRFNYATASSKFVDFTCYNVVTAY
jgi:hypothetical protein